MGINLVFFVLGLTLCIFYIFDKYGNKLLSKKDDDEEDDEKHDGRDKTKK
jgi:hypothetical protein